MTDAKPKCPTRIFDAIGGTVIAEMEPDGLTLIINHGATGLRARLTMGETLDLMALIAGNARVEGPSPR